MKKTIVFFGDSITTASKSKSNPLGDGFVSIFAAKVAESNSNIQIINAGINGHTVDDLWFRYINDVVSKAPNIVVIKIGINDAYNDFQAGNQGSRLSNYNKTYRALLDNLLAKLPGIQILLVTPYYISDSKHDPLYERMHEYGKCVASMAMDYKIPLLNAQDIFDEAVKRKPAQTWAPDHIHPGVDGHELLAAIIYDFIKSSTDIGLQ